MKSTADKAAIVSLLRDLEAERARLGKGEADSTALAALLERAGEALTTLVAERQSLRESSQALLAEERRDLEARVEERTAELENARQRLELTVNQLPVAVIVVEAEHLTLNRQAEDLMTAVGLDPKSSTAYRELELLKPDGTPYTESDHPLVRAVERGVNVTAEQVEVRFRDGSSRQFEISAAPLRERGGGAVLVAIDVTDRERRERAEREFVSNAAHQLRNPLAAIMSSIEVLQTGAKDDPDARDRFLGHIERESARLTRLARTLLILARAQSTVEESRREIVQIEALLAEVAQRIRPRDGLTIEIRCAPGAAAVANAELLEEALVCLADNAVRHAGGDKVRLAARSENGSLMLEVLDEGRGIPREVQERMFERFHAAGGRNGFGLGLSIAAQAAHATGGQLEIESEVGRGTTARITLPAARMLTP